MCCVMGYTGHDLSAAKFKEYLLRTVMRGPDDQRVVEGPFGLMGFGRLAIMGLTPEGMQPFYRGADCVVCNGELYGFRFEKEILKRRGLQVPVRLRLRDPAAAVLRVRSGHVPPHGLRIRTDPVRFPQGPAHCRPRPHRHPAAVLRLLQVQPPDRFCIRDAEPDRLVR